MVKTPESMAIEVVRLIHLAAHQPKIAKVSVKVNDEVASYLNNKKRKEITRLEDDANVSVQILGSSSHYPEHLELELADADGKVLQMPE
jgi:ribonuclease E